MQAYAKYEFSWVDDEPEIREVLCELLSDDYECLVAASAEEALERLRGERFELVISDIMMSGMSGLEMVPHVRARSPETVIVMISGVQTIESAIKLCASARSITL